MPIVRYYLGRPAHVWIAAMSSRGSARKDNNSRAVRGSTPPGRSTQPGAARRSNVAGGRRDWRAESLIEGGVNPREEWGIFRMA